MNTYSPLTKPNFSAEIIAERNVWGFTHQSETKKALVFSSEEENILLTRCIITDKIHEDWFKIIIDIMTGHFSIIRTNLIGWKCMSNRS